MNQVAVDLSGLEAMVREEFSLAHFGIGQYLVHPNYGLLCDPKSDDSLDRIPHLVGPTGKFVQVGELDPTIGYTADRVNGAVYSYIQSQDSSVQFFSGSSEKGLFEPHYFCRIPLRGRGDRQRLIIDGVGLFPFQDAKHVLGRVYSDSKVVELWRFNIPIAQSIGVYNYKGSQYLVSLDFRKDDLDLRTVSQILKFRWVIENLTQRAKAEYSSSTFLHPELGRGGYCQSVVRRAKIPTKPEDAFEFLTDLQRRRIFHGQRDFMNAPRLSDEFEVVYRHMAAIHLGIIHRRAHPRDELQVRRDAKRF